jgi:hypothetical protein
MLRYYIFIKRKEDKGYDSEELCLPKLKSSKALKAKNRVYSDDEDSLPELGIPRCKTTPSVKHSFDERPDLEVPIKNTPAPSKPHPLDEGQSQATCSTIPMNLDPQFPSTSTRCMLVDDDVNFRLTDENANVVTVCNPLETVSFFVGSYDSGDATLPLDISIENVGEDQNTLPLDFSIENVGEDQNTFTCTAAPVAQKVRFHQGNTYQELIKLYKNKNYQLDIDESICKVERVLPNGETEKGEGIGLI